MNRKLVVFGITMASGGIENLMHYFLMDCSNKKKFDEIIIVSSYSAIAFEEEYIKNGIRVLHISSWRDGLSYKKDIDSILSSVSLNDLVYVNLSTYCNWKLLSCLKKTKCKIVIHGHNAHVGNIIKKLIHLIGRNKYKKIGYKIAVSEECSKFMFGGKHNIIISNGIDSEKYNFILENRQELRNKLSIEDKKLVIGCIGRISQEKNQLFLAKLSKKYSNILFLFLGDFMSEKYKKIILRSASPNCIFVGHKKDVEFYLSGMDALIIPSKREAFPLVAAEALTNGMPIFFLEKIKQKIPLSLSKNENCFFIDKNGIDLGIIKISNEKRMAGDITNNNEYDINEFLNKLYCFLNSEVFHG